MKTAPVNLKELFRQEFRKMVAVISRVYGLKHLAIAEDVVSETFLLAAETWGVKGIPANPTAWLYTVAKNKTLYHLRRTKIYENKVLPSLVTNSQDETMTPDFSEQNIKDSQLQMIFAICNPAISSEAQIGLALRILCGFGIDEIADAFFASKETINKRLYRSREKLRTEKVKLEVPPPDQIRERLDNVLHTIYLLFNEGYYSKTQNQVLRKEFCAEALRLGLMLCEYEPTNLPATNALTALMCFHASRFKARQNSAHAHVLYAEQNRDLWDTELIRQGLYHLDISLTGNEISFYHLEARIASLHSDKTESVDKWEEILHLYDQLLQTRYSESAALNRAYALYKAKGWQAALAEAEKLQLLHNHFYHALLGELYQHVDRVKAMDSFQKAYAFAKTKSEKKIIHDKMDQLIKT